MFVFGGERKGNLLNELWRFDFGRRSWDRILMTGTSMIPNPMSRHAAILCPVSPPQMKSSWSEPSQIEGQSCSHQESTPAVTSSHVVLKQSPSCSLPPASLPSDTHHKKALTLAPPKSISMCFGFNQHHNQSNSHHHLLRRRNSSRRSQHQPLQEMNVVEATRKAIKYFRVHSALSINMCWRDSGITMSDNEEEEEENQTTSKDISDNSQPNDGNSRISTDTGLESESRAISPPVLASKTSDLTGSNYATVLRRRRKRRPRPFSEQIDPVLYESVGGGAAAGSSNGGQVIEDVDMEWPNFGHKRHTVHESMSYYSLCFPSPQLGTTVNHKSRSLRKNIPVSGSSDRRLTNVHTFTISGSTGASLTSSAKSKSNPPHVPPLPPLRHPDEISYRKNELFSPDGLDFTLNEFEEDDVLDFRRMSVNFQQPTIQSPAPVLADEGLSPEAEESETSFIEKGADLKSPSSTSNSSNYHNDDRGTGDEYQRLEGQSSREMDACVQLPSMFVFGGREERRSGFTQKQAMVVWKLCLNI